MIHAGQAAVVIEIPVRTRNFANMQTGNTKLAAMIRTRQRAEQRQLCKMFLMGALARAREGGFGWPVVVTMTRISAGELDYDGLVSSLKAVRDAAAESLGLPNDKDETKVRFVYRQRLGKKRQYAVEVRAEAYEDGIERRV